MGLLIKEAKKYKSFDEFSHAFSVAIMHGRYYHITDDPNFKINIKYSPRDMSSLAAGFGADLPGLMVTSHLEPWLEEFNNRQYVALIDLSNVPRKDYWQVNRGFGNEIWVDNPAKAKVIKVMTRAQAARDDRSYQNILPKSREELYEKVWKRKGKL